MRSLLWPLILCIVLGVLARHVLGVWLPAAYVPDLLLACVLVIALTEESAGAFWLVAFVGGYVDLESSLLFGSYMVGFVGIFIVARFLFRKFIPAERVYVALPVAYAISSILLLVWIFCAGVVANLLGWPVAPSFAGLYIGPWLVAIALGAVATLVVYLVWLEVLHRTGKPIRFK